MSLTRSRVKATSDGAACAAPVPASVADRPAPSPIPRVSRRDIFPDIFAIGSPPHRPPAVSMRGADAIVKGAQRVAGKRAGALRPSQVRREPVLTARGLGDLSGTLR